MKFYTGAEWLMIDAASHFGHDKLTFEKRIEWTKTNLNKLESLVDEAETKPLYYKAVLAIRKAQAGLPTGHLVGVDASCSGIQLMSVLTGCVQGANATGLVDPNRRADAYTDTTEAMNRYLVGMQPVSRKDAKRAVMTTMYGSKKTPKEIFGEDTPELEAFYKAIQEIAPGAWDLLQVLLAAWNAGALAHVWKLPDGFDARVKVMQQITSRIEVDELGHSSFTYQYYVNEGSEKGISLPANVTHSVDAYVLREMHRRCNYDLDQVLNVRDYLVDEYLQRNQGKQALLVKAMPKLQYYIDQFNRSTLASAVIIPHINAGNVQALSDEHIEALLKITGDMIQHKPFELVTVHDEFKALANNVNYVRYHYKVILAEIADSNLVDDLLSQIHGYHGTFPKRSFNLADKIRSSEYALC